MHFDPVNNLELWNNTNKQVIQRSAFKFVAGTYLLSITMVCNIINFIHLNGNVLVGGLTGIFCSKCQDHVIRFFRPSFDRKIDLKWFRDD